MLDYLRLVYIHKRVNVSSEVEKEQKVLVLYIINGGSLEMDFILYMYMLCSLSLYCVKEEETRKLRQAIEKRKPDVIVVAASSRYSLY